MSEEVSKTPEVVEEKTVTPQAPATSETGTVTPTDDAFNAEQLEQSFGLPPGSLKDVKDEASAFTVIRDFTDKTLTAGLGLTEPARIPEPEPTKKPAEDGKAKPTTPINEEVQALRAEMAEVKGFLSKQIEQQNQQFAHELDQRVSAEIDGWKSPKYGVGTNRNYKQTKAVKELKELLVTHVAGLKATGQPVSTVEVLLRRARLFDDDGYTNAFDMVSKTNTPLGTPGARRDLGGKDSAPKNIHEALMQNRS